VPEELKKKRQFYYEEEPIKSKPKKIFKRRRKKKIYQASTLKIQKLMTNGSLILEFSLVSTLVESWSSRKIMIKIILLTLLHMQ